MNAIKMALDSIMEKKGRSFLAMLGIIIGVTAVLVFVALVEGYNADMTAYYEKITILGTEINVSSIVSAKFGRFDLGDKKQIVISESGTIIDVCSVGTYSNADMLGILGKNSVSLLCGISINGVTSEAYEGQLVKIVESSIGEITAYNLNYSSGRTFDLETNMLGSYSLADGAAIFECVGDSAVQRINLGDIMGDSVSSGNIRYYHLNENNEVDVLLFDDVTGDLYTYGTLSVGSSGSGDNQKPTLEVTNGEGTKALSSDRYMYQYEDKAGSVVSKEDGA